MKKALSLALALMMLLTMCVVPVMAAEPDGSQSNPYYVATPMSAPGLITIPANSTVYYQYKAAVFNGWSVEGYGLSAITVDGVVYDEADLWGTIKVPFKFTMMSPAIVGYVNNSAEEVQVMLTHNEPVGTISNPAELEAGENSFSIPTNIMNYVSVFVPNVSGEYTIFIPNAEDFDVAVYTDGNPEEGTAQPLVNGSLTLTLESYIPVYITVMAVGMTGDATVTITAPKAGSAANPFYLDEYTVEGAYTLDGATYFTVSGALIGSNLKIQADSAFTAVLNGEEFASEGNVLSLPLDTEEWSMELIVTGTGAVSFAPEYPLGTENNPANLQNGKNDLIIAAGVGSYYYNYVVVADGVLTLTVDDRTNISYLGMADAEYNDFAILADGKYSVSLPVTTGEIIAIEVYTEMDEETSENLPVDTTLNVVMSPANVVNGSFETGDLTGWDAWQEGYVLPEAANGGQYGVEIKGNGGWGGMLSQLVPVIAGETYNVSLDIKALSAGANIQICDGDNGGAPQLGSAWYDKNEWKTFTWTVIPTGDYIFINLCGGGTGVAEDLYVDNVSVEVLVPEIANGDFENLDSTDWAYNSGEHDIVVDAHTGNWALQLTNPNMWGEAAVQTIAVKANTQYNITWWSKRVDGTGAFNLYLVDGESFSNVKLVEGKNWMNDTSGEWISHKVVIDTEASTSLLIKFSSEAANAGTILIDDVAISPVKPASFDGYIYNGDFETGDLTNWENLWGSCSTSIVKGYESNNALYVEMPGQWQIVRQKVVVEPNTDYVLTAWVKNDSHLTLMVKNGADSTDMASVATAGTAVWTPYQVEFNSGAETSVFVMLMANEAGAYATVDNVSLAKKESAPVLPLTNGDFEIGTAYGWEIWQGTSISADAALNGGYGAHLVGDGGWGGMLNQTLNVEAGKSYALTFWYKVNASGFNYQFSGIETGTMYGSGWKQNAEWSQEVVKFTAEGDTQIKLNFCGGGTGVAEDAYIDDVMLIELKESSFDGYVYNGDFETGIADYWNVYTGTIVSEDAAYEGEYGLLMHSDGGWGGTGDQDIVVEAGKKYQVSFWIKTVANGVNFQVKENGSDLASGWINDAAAWTLKTYEFTASSNEIKLNFCGGGNDLDTIVYVDNVSVIELKDPSFDGFIYNGDFEAGSLTKWDVYQSTVLSKDAAYAGTYGAHLAGNGGWGALLEQTFTGLKKGYTYTFSFWYKANSSGSNWTIKVNGENAAAGWISDTEWTQITAEFVAAADGEAILNFCGGGTGVAEDLYLDSILLVEQKPAAPEYKPGDVNGDNRVNNRDLGQLQQFLNEYELAKFNELAADVTGDGRVNNRDLGILQQYLNEYDVELKPGKEK